MVIMREEYSVVQTISDFLSVVTISTCFILKIPQILNILRMKNAAGISIVGLLMELSSYTIMFSYNYRSGYALLSYMEYPIILLQELVLILCVLYYKDCLNIGSFVVSSFYFSIATGMLTGVIPREFLVYLVPLSTPIGASSKVVQLVEIIRLKNSDSVSVLTWFISTFTNMTRIFTIFVDSADLSLLLNFTINTMLSFSVMVAAYYYKSVPKRVHKKTD